MSARFEDLVARTVEQHLRGCSRVVPAAQRQLDERPLAEQALDPCLEPELARVSDPALDPDERLAPPPVVDQPATEVDVRATRVGPEVRLARELEAPLELGWPSGIAGDHLGGADVVERVDEPLEVIDLLGDRDRLRAQR